MNRTRTQARGSLLRHLSEREVLSALQGHGPLSRADIARRTGISGPTVTRTVSALLEAGLVEEGDVRQQALGRPGRVLRLATKTVSVLGAVVGAKQCELVSAGLDGQIHAEHVRTFATPSRYGDLVNAFVRHARQMIAERPAQILGLGVSMPGLLNRRERRTVFSPNLHQTDGQRLGEDLQRRLGVETAVVQESHALCLAEMTYGAARDVADFAMLDISEGMGVGVVHGGHILEGHSGLGGELGHITVDIDGKRCGCGNRGCLETVATDTALATAISARLGRKYSFDELLPLLQRGDIEADGELAEVVEYLAVALAAVINLFNPSQLFVHGRLLDAQSDLFECLLERTRQRALAPAMADCSVVRAQGNKRLGAIAGIIHRLTTGRAEPLERVPTL
jgi:predicted NBD/HSP70 family sugar kinase